MREREKEWKEEEKHGDEKGCQLQNSSDWSVKEGKGKQDGVEKMVW